MKQETRTTRRYWSRNSSPKPWWPGGAAPLLGLGLLFGYGVIETAPAVERDTAQQVRTHLQAQGFDDLIVNADGQNVSVTAPTTYRVEQIRTLAGATQCDTWLLGNQTCPNRITVDASGESASVGIQPRLHDFSLLVSGRDVVLRGEVPTATMKTAMLNAASQRFDNVSDELTVSGALATDAYDWAVERAWPLLTSVKNGQVQWQDGRLSAAGEIGAIDESDVRATFADSAFPSRLGMLDLTAPPLAMQCNERFASALATSRIEFRTGSAEIATSSEPLLTALARLANECPVQLQVAGHTDSVGNDDNNRALSLARASAVVDALVGRGVLASRLSAAGFGESQPIADNETAEGRARNRRIEITAMSGQE